MGERYLIAGCGFVGTQLARRLRDLGHDVWAVARSAPRLPEGAQWIAADLTQPESLRRLPDVDYVVFAASAGESSDERYEAVYVQGTANVLEALARKPVRRVCFVSSTAVYHQNDGEWVDESSATNPTHFSGLRTLEAEAVVQSGAVPAVVLRCAGIYGPGRTRLIDSVRSGSARWSAGAPRYTNRIHRDDVAGAVLHLLSLPAPDPVYLGVDEYPAPEREVYEFLAERLGVPAPACGSGEGSARAAGNKRCNGAKLRSSGYRFRFPTFREGYGAMMTPSPGQTAP